MRMITRVECAPMMTRRIGSIVLSLLLLTAALHAQVDPELLAGLKARAIGPASMSGRVASIDVVESNPDIVYVGAATGGLWKSTNGGLSFTPVFDDQPVAAIGAVAIYQASPEIVWVGTGEGNVRNSMSVGNGVYKSMDGGKTWQYLGLEKSERIYRIVLHPRDPNVAWVAAMGQAWGQNPERGIFKTVDGGKTWTKVLYANDRSGAGDLVIDPVNPNKLFASLWEYRRWPWFFNSGGPGSGLYVTYDGGANWNDISGNLPDAPADDLVMSGSKLVLATDVGVFVTSAGSPGTWQRYGSGLPNAIPNDLTTTPGGAIVAVTHGRGMFKIAAP